MTDSLLNGVSIETPKQHEEYLRQNEYKYRRYFKDHESYELFMMLPVDERGRATILRSMHEEERSTLEKKQRETQKSQQV
jgi:hypothetical protein